MHPKYRSSLKMLNLAILCPVKWIKKYSMAKVLKPLMADVALLESVSVEISFCCSFLIIYVSTNRKEQSDHSTFPLQENGVQLNIGQSIRSFEGTLSLVLADNLGSNGIGGFMESFSAKRPCRFCMGILDEFQTKVVLLNFSILLPRHNQLEEMLDLAILFFAFLATAKL